MKHLPTIIIALFFVLYFIATSFYPGGHHLDYEAETFSWINNYWCDLYYEGYYNDRPNEAMNIAIAATILVAFGIGYFFYIYPDYIQASPIWSKLIRICGVIAALSIVPVFIDRFHSISIIISSLFGVFALTGVIKSLWNNKMTRILWTAWISLFLIFLTNVMYYFQIGIEWLPQIQKLAFVVVLIWLCLLNLSFGERIDT